MLNVNDMVKVIGKTICGDETKECIPIGTICKVTEVYEDDDEKYYGIVPLNDTTIYPFHYLESELEKGELKWIPETNAKETMAPLRLRAQNHTNPDE